MVFSCEMNLGKVVKNGLILSEMGMDMIDMILERILRYWFFMFCVVKLGLVGII